MAQACVCCGVVGVAEQIDMNRSIRQEGPAGAALCAARILGSSMEKVGAESPEGTSACGPHPHTLDGAEWDE